jgi:hypothetical protein
MQSTIIQKTIHEAVKLLKASGAKYIVIDLEGNRYGDGSLELATPTVKSRRQKREYGSLIAYYAPYVKDLSVGDVATIPFGPYNNEPEALRSAIAAWCSLNWGTNAHKSCTTKTTVEILRTA